jgi:glutamine amidotransferase
MRNHRAPSGPNVTPVETGVRVAIIDYGMGNLRSVANAVQALGGRPAVVRQPAALRDADHIILPGVGTFGDGMRNLEAGDWVGALEDEVLGCGKPFLGICLGMQLLATYGTEHGRFKGLNWVEGSADRLERTDERLRLPHIGWNDVRFTRPDGMYAGLGVGQVFYFIHSYALRPADEAVVSGWCDYGTTFAASIERDNVWATQFHPEKSQKAGLTLLRNFLLAASPARAVTATC